MCGIGGIIYRHKSVSKEELIRLTSFLQKRGPDYSDTYVSNQVGLAHTRLKIIDLSENANQPMSNNGVTIVFNGEIYNFEYIKSLPEFRNFQFKSYSDTEVILAAYHVIGIKKFLELANGMFAFALYDSKLNKVIFARDRFGKKPLYIFQNDNELSFCSDIRALSKSHSLSINHNALDFYLSELSVPQPLSIWKEIRQINSSTYEEFSLDTWTSNSTKYWELPEINDSLSLEDAIQLTEEKLLESIMRREISDVPLGYFLSGGIDSGLIVSMQAHHSSSILKTFTVGIEGMVNDESSDARRVATRYKTDHTEIIVSPSPLKEIREIISYVGEPFADSSIIPSSLISKAIKKEVTVAISGDGGDELFGGYPQYQLAHNADYLHTAYPNKYRREVSVLADKIISRFYKRENLGSYNKFFKLSPAEKLSRGMGFNRYEKNQLMIGNAYFLEQHFNNIWSNEKASSQCEKLMRASIHSRLLNDYLVKVDRASMFNSLEVRSPFLDFELASLAFSIPNELKFYNGTTKFILKTLAKKYIREDVMKLPKKGFTIPISDWIRTSWKREIELNLNNLKGRNIFNGAYIDTILNDHMRSKKDFSHKIWLLFCLEVWLFDYYNEFRF